MQGHHADVYGHDGGNEGRSGDVAGGFPKVGVTFWGSPYQGL